MSSSRISYNRKRRSDDESSSSDSDEDIQPVKKPRLWNREPSMFPKYLLYFRDILATKFQSFVHWINELPIGNYSKDNMLKNTIERRIPIEMEEVEDGEIDVIEILDDDDEEEEDLIIDEDFTDIPEDATESNSLRRNSIPITPNPLSSSTPYCKDRRTSRGRTLNSLSLRPVNGCNNSKLTQQGKKSNSHRQKMRCNRNAAPITNPSSDIEILLDTRQTPFEESDDLEILSEMPNSRSSRRLTRQTVSTNISKSDEQSKECNGDSNSSIVNGKAVPFERQTSNKSFTAHEVFRLQEKAHYQLILDKMIGTSTYHPVLPKQDAKPAAIHVDLTEDEEPVGRDHSKKGISDKPVNEFLQKYYRPCQFKPCTAPKDDSDDEQIFTKDEDVQVIETKLPEYKPKSRRKPDIMSTDWINELKRTINLETEQRLQIVSAHEEKLERYRKRRDAKLIEEKLLRGQSISPKQAEKDEFPELTSEMDDQIDWALGPGSPIEALSTFKDSICNRSDMVTLTGLNWLNDSVINFYLALIRERGKNHPVYPSVYTFNSYFYASLKNKGPNGVMRWTRRIEDKKNIFEFDIVIVPLHLEVHWALCVVDNRFKKIKYYDSMKGRGEECLETIRNYLVVEKKEKLGIAMDPNEYSLESVQDIPQQMNGSDCGMFTLKYAEYISRDAPITFSQDHMQYFRRRMVLEILEKRLF